MQGIEKMQYLSLLSFHYYNDNPELHSFSSAYLFSWNYRPGKLKKKLMRYHTFIVICFQA